MDHAVVIAGGGPTGLMLAAELALAGVDVAIVERRLDQSLEGTRAGGLNARSLEVLEQRGIAERFVAQGTKHPAAYFAGVMFPLGELPTRFPFVLALGQEKIEQALAAWAGEVGVRWYRGCEVAGFEQDDGGVAVRLNGRMLRARYLVGCDGGRSVVRKAAGIDFAGWDATTSYLLAEARLRDPAPPTMGKLDGGRVRIVLEQPDERGDSPALEDLRAALVAAHGTDFGVHDATWISRFTDAARQAVRYRDRRVLLAGDAAHVHSPIGGQGLNTGVQDAVNLGWKLARVVAGTSPEALLDSYRAERHPVAARVLELTRAGTALRRSGDTAAAKELVTPATLAGLDIRYDLGGGHPLVGQRMPDLELKTTRVSALLHRAQPVVLEVDELVAPPPELAGVRRVLIRPDGHVEAVAV